MAKKIAIIGGNSGIGLATVHKLLIENHEVFVVSRNKDELIKLGLEVQNFDAETANQLIWPETLDGLVYFPGSISLKPFHRLTQEDFLRDLQINLLGAINVLQSALPSLKASGSASVVMFSTIAVTQGMSFHASIAAAKGAVEGLVKSLAAEWAPYIRVNAIAPSLTDTPLAGALLNNDAKKEASAKRHPLQLIGNDHDIASLVMYLLSDDSKFMTGQILRPDGGLSSVRLF
jgi:3-oxoacyl-[acyl-carrier protein] reductase